MSDPIIPGGFVMLPRAYHPIDEMPPLYRDVWQYILKKASHTDNERKGYKRGECLISIPELQKAFTYYVGFKKVGPTKHQIDNALRWLRSAPTYTALYDNGYDTKTTMITTTRTTRGMIVKVHDYAFLQDKSNYEYDTEHDNENTANTPRIRQQPDTIYNNGFNNDNNYKDTSDAKSNNSHIETEFNDWWNLYNKKVGKKKSATKFKSLRKTYELDVIVNGTKDYLKTITDKQYQKHPYTFLNGEHFNDEYSPNQYSNYPNGDSTDDVDIDDMLNQLD